MIYKRIYVHNHPLFLDKKRVYEHRLVMAEFLGRPLLRTEDVHHKDGDTLNNQIDNLEIKMHGKHVAYHWTGKHHTIEARKKMSLAKKGKHFTAEHRRKLSLAQKGFKDRHHTVATRQRISLAMKEYHLQQRSPGI